MWTLVLVIALFWWGVAGWTLAWRAQRGWKLSIRAHTREVAAHQATIERHTAFLHERAGGRW